MAQDSNDLSRKEVNRHVFDCMNAAKALLDIDHLDQRPRSCDMSIHEVFLRKEKAEA
jgi:hypothetical protein